MKIKRLIKLLLLISVVSPIMLSSCKKSTSENPDYSQNKGEFKDNRDGEVYKWVKIENQVWMAENLKYLPNVSPSSNGSNTDPYYYVYGYDGTNVSEAKATTNYETYGVLYNYEAAKSSCPSGWHLPSDDEWKILTDYLGGSGVAGGKLKETGTTHWHSPNAGATNTSGFTALPGGYRCYDRSFSLLGGYGYWWSATAYGSIYAWYRGLIYDYDRVNRTSPYKEFGFSVRCVRD